MPLFGNLKCQSYPTITRKLSVVKVGLISALYLNELTSNSGYTCMRVAHKSYSESRDKMHTSSPDYTGPKRPTEPHRDVEICTDVF